jgi:hypothetical protein
MLEPRGTGADRETVSVYGSGSPHRCFRSNERFQPLRWEFMSQFCSIFHKYKRTQAAQSIPFGRRGVTLLCRAQETGSGRPQPNRKPQASAGQPRRRLSTPATAWSAAGFTGNCKTRIVIADAGLTFRTHDVAGHGCVGEPSCQEPVAMKRCGRSTTPAQALRQRAPRMDISPRDREPTLSELLQGSRFRLVGADLFGCQPLAERLEN